MTLDGEKLQRTFSESDPALRGAEANPIPELPEPAYIQIRRLREAKGWTQQTLAAHLKVDRSLIAQYETGKRRPSQVTMQRIHGLTKFTAPRREDVVVTKQELNGILEELEKAGKDELDQALALVSYSYLRVVSTIILSATGAIQTTVSPKFIELFLSHRKELMEEKRLQSSEQARNVTPAAQSWSQGNGVYSESPSPDDPQTPTGRDT